MHAGQSPEVRAASERFAGFFRELGRTFIERDDLLTQIALALLSREHVLMTGPPGTAKSGVAGAVLGRIVDERTGKPSVFSRQFTESTVQTDLVGPIDFKTLMQTGRTEHFTDEGMLGAVHAFLDEVLDGRDMLLRTTLNVLHERELKQGAKTTSGQIECALMTTNRYLAEVLESSRETLLAFIDRIAFISFVPKGFTDAASLGQVVRSQIGGARPRSLVSLLTIQDLDVLQAMTDSIVVPDAICDALCRLLEQLDADLAAAAKHDPTFVPTRYLSTRTAVRLGKVLRAAAAYDAIMSDPGRELEVEHEDLATLRLSLLLSGPNHDKLARLLERETDPRERRQLSILRTEREIFERALARLPKTERAPRKATALGDLERAVSRAVPTNDPSALLETAAKLAEVSDAGGHAAREAEELLERTLTHLGERAVRLGTTAGAGLQSTTGEIVGELSQLADGLERASGSTRPVARWLRGRAIRILLDTAALTCTPIGETLSLGSADDARSERALQNLESVLERCATLRASGAEDPGAESFDRAIAVAIARVEDELAAVWDAKFRESVTHALSRVGPEQLAVLLAALGPALADIDGLGARLGALGGNADSLKARVVAPRLEPLVRVAFDRVPTTDRLELAKQVGVLVEQLQDSGLLGVIPKTNVLRLATGALTRSERLDSASTERHAPDFAGYRALRTSEQRVSLTYALVELAIQLSPKRPAATASPAELTAEMTSFIGSLPEALRNQVIDLDLARIGRAVTLVEAWWTSLARPISGGTSGSAEADLRRLASSKFFHVTRDEGALLRFALECRVIADVFPEASERVATMRSRIATVEAESAELLNALRRGQSDAAWVDLLGPSSSSGSRPATPT